jgi:hypothetical protein
MGSTTFTRRMALAGLLGLCLTGLPALAQQAAKPFEPFSGQPGKDVVWVPTPQTLVDKMLEMAKVTPNDFVMDLGSGDGRTVITAARRGVKALGIEYNPEMVELSKQNAAKAKVGDKASFMKADLFETDFSQATVITMFLLPDINLRLRPKILDMKPGTRVVSNTFTMGDWSPDETASVGDENAGYYRTALLWIVPAKVDGTWRLGDAEMTLTQEFQKFSGTLRSGSNATAISMSKLNGEAINFSAGGVEYTGRVKGNVMEGTMKSRNGAGSPWTATRVGDRK